MTEHPEDERAARDVAKRVEKSIKEDAELANFAGTPDPAVSHGDAMSVIQQLTPNQRKVLEGLKEGFSVNKIARLHKIPVRSAKKAAAALHKKFPAIPPCTPPGGTTARVISRAQSHNFVVEIAIPWGMGTNLRWRERMDKSKVQGHKQSFTPSGMQEYFSLGRQVSVKTTHKSIFVTVKNVWGSCPEDASRQAWDIAAGAAHELQVVYGFTFKDKISMRFRGGEWALVDHEVARLCKKAGIKPETFIDGKRVMWKDDTPGQSLEFSKKELAERSYHDEEARVFKGLTNEALAEKLDKLMELNAKLIQTVDIGLGCLLKSQEHLVRQVSALMGTNQGALPPQESEKKGRVSYIG